MIRLKNFLSLILPLDYGKVNRRNGKIYKVRSYNLFDIIYKTIYYMVSECGRKNGRTGEEIR